MKYVIQSKDIFLQVTVVELKVLMLDNYFWQR